MAEFIFFAALLAALAVAFAVSALWRDSRRLAVALMFAVPLAAGGLYLLKGAPAALNPQAVVASDAHEDMSPATIEQAIEKLQARIQANPDNAEQIVLLARTYMATGQFALAAPLYVRAMKLLPDDLDLTVEYAEALLRTSPDRRFPPEATTLLEKAVAANPSNQRALFFLGLQRMQAGRPADAAATWEKLMPLLDAATAAELRKQLDAARSAAGLPPLPPMPERAAPAAQGLSIEVRLDPALAAKVQPGDVLFVFARPAGVEAGPPLAVKRVVIDALPVRLQLTDDDSPMPTAKLSSQAQVALQARVSKSGSVAAGPGDVTADPVTVGTDSRQPVTLVLTHVAP